MYNHFLKLIHEEKLFEKSDRLLLGISGGVDSVVLANLIEKLGNEFALAHCNFNLRGNESDDDEKFVLDLADRLGVKCYLSSFPTKEYANENGISIEMAARELRYDWFEKIREENNFDWILVGHHLDDVLETFILNLSRGTGIRGLSGIKLKVGKLIRPLLNFTRSEIESYAAEMKLYSRHDASNDDINIRRNKVRHQVLPLLEELNPSFRKNLHKTIKFLHDTEQVYLSKIEEIKKQIVIEDDLWIKLSIEKLNKLEPQLTYLYELLRPYHFKADVVEEISRSLNAISGNQFYSSTHRIVVDRDDLIITALDANGQTTFYIEKDVQFIYEPEHLKITIERNQDDYIIPTSSDVAVLDFDKLRFPLVLRKWQMGEYFRPLGMEGFKKLSDFFVDEKYSIPEKENAWILASENKVAWIVGKRIDDRYKITKDTNLILRIERIKSNNA